MTSLHRDQKFGDCAVHEGKCIPPLRDWGGLGEFLTVEGHQALKHQAENKHLTSDSYDWLIRFFPFTWVQKAAWWPPFPLPHWGKCMLKRGLDLNSRRVTSKSNVSEHVIASFSITFFSIQWDSWAGYSFPKLIHSTLVGKTQSHYYPIFGLSQGSEALWRLGNKHTPLPQTTKTLSITVFKLPWPWNSPGSLLLSYPFSPTNLLTSIPLSLNVLRKLFGNPELDDLVDDLVGSTFSSFLRWGPTSCLTCSRCSDERLGPCLWATYSHGLFWSMWLKSKFLFVKSWWFHFEGWACCIKSQVVV